MQVRDERTDLTGDFGEVVAGDCEEGVGLPATGISSGGGGSGVGGGVGTRLLGRREEQRPGRPVAVVQLLLRWLLLRLQWLRLLLHVAVEVRRGAGAGRGSRRCSGAGLLRAARGRGGGEKGLAVGGGGAGRSRDGRRWGVLARAARGMRDGALMVTRETVIRDGWVWEACEGSERGANVPGQRCLGWGTDRG